MQAMTRKLFGAWTAVLSTVSPDSADNRTTLSVQETAKRVLPKLSRFGAAPCDAVVNSSHPLSIPTTYSLLTRHHLSRPHLDASGRRRRPGLPRGQAWTQIPWIGALVSFVCAAFLLSISPTTAYAQDSGAAKPNSAPQSKEAQGNNPFELRRVDFWNDKPKAVTNNGQYASPQPATVSSASLPNQPANDQARKEFWTDATLSGEGKGGGYVPPKILLDLLEDPNPENAQKYLDWQRRRIEKIVKAQHAIDQVRAQSRNPSQSQKPDSEELKSDRADAPRTGDQEKKASLPQDPQRADPVSPVPSDPAPGKGESTWADLKILYFFSPACPHCTGQEGDIAAFMERAPGAELKKYDLQDPVAQAVANAYGIRGTPTVLLIRTSNSQTVKVEGRSSPLRILTAAQSLFNSVKP